MTEPLAPYQHFRTTADASVDQGVYRVVGTPDDQVTLLRVGDSSGTRRVTGQVVTVTETELSVAFESADNPDAGFGIADLVDRVLTSFKAIFRVVKR